MKQPLLCIPSPRDIEDFDNALSKLVHYDQYIVKYYPAPVAYDKLEKFFLANKKFDPMVVIPDDLIVDPAGLESLLVSSFHYPDAVISGICNFDMYNHASKYCFRVIGDPGFYPNMGHLDEYFSKYNVQWKGHLIRVEFNAFACCVIPRKIKEKIPFRHDENGSGVDINFCKDCMDNNIDLLVDHHVVFKHLAGRKGGFLENWGVGVKEPTTFRRILDVLL